MLSSTSESRHAVHQMASAEHYSTLVDCECLQMHDHQQCSSCSVAHVFVLLFSTCVGIVLGKCVDNALFGLLKAVWF